MNLQSLLSSVTPDIYQNLKRAVELGKWPDGRRLSREQRKLCLQAVIAYEHQHLPPEQHTGYIHTESHDHCGHSGEVALPDEVKPVKWL